MTKKGFSQEKKRPSPQRNYKTIFERVREKAGDTPQTPEWYRKNVRSIAIEYREHPEYLNKDERKDKRDPEDNQDKNRLRKYPRKGRLYIFEYKATKKRLPYYDAFPLVYVIDTRSDSFIGANLHYIHPKKRPYIIQRLKEDRIEIPRVCFHKYILANVNDYLLDLAIEEWETAISLPIEHFITERNNTVVDYKSSDVWAETNKVFYDKLKARRIVKGYGKISDIQDVTGGKT